MLRAGGGVDVIIMILAVYKKGYEMKYIVRLMILWLVFLSLYSTIGAQSDEAEPDTHPLFDMLRRVPIEFANTEISYTDFRAVEDALPYVERPALGEVFYGGWPGYTQRWYTFQTNIREVAPMALRGGGEIISQTIGFEIRDINRLFTFGHPPNNGTIWSGDFDEEAIRTAHTARGYSAVTINGAEAWCYEGDCSIGTRANLQEIERTNLFDSRLGRKIPFVMWDDTLISTEHQSILEDVANLTENTLYDDADIRALAQVATAPDGLLVNWLLWRMDIATGSDMSLTTLEREGLSADTTQFSTYEYQNLPPYDAVAIADR